MTFVRDSLDSCVKCTICETYCPVSNATTLFPGPKYAGPQAERYRTGPSVDDSLDYCSSCGICTQVCPQGVKVAEINSRARAELKKARGGVPLRDRLLAMTELTGRLGTPVAPLANRTLANRSIRGLIERVAGVHRLAPMPAFAGRTFQGWARRHRPPVPAPGKAVVYFHGCSANYFEPWLGEMAVAILEHNGFQVIIPPQSCCGLPLQSNGAFDAARTYVRRLVKALAPYAHRGYRIVATSTSCGLMLKREAHEILGEDGDDLRAVSRQMWDVCELLADLSNRGRLATDLRPLPQTVAYHAPCQQRGHQMGKPALDLLELIPDLRVIELDRECCGIAGTYGLKREKYQIAMDVGAGLFADIREARPDASACDSETCRWQIVHGSGYASVHPLELLYRAYGLGGDRPTLRPVER